MHHNLRKLGGHPQENKTFKVFPNDSRFDLKIRSFCDVTPRWVVDSYWYFNEVASTSSESKNSTPLLEILNPEDEDAMIPQNIGNCLPNDIV